MRPGAFFRARRRPGLVLPLTYGLAAGTIGFLAQQVWALLLSPPGYNSQSSSWMIIFSPLLVLASILMVGGLLHLAVKITGPDNQGFEATFRVVAYSQATRLICLLPVVGIWISTIWGLVVTVVGLGAVHGQGIGRSILAFAIFLAIMVTAVFIIAYMFGFVQGA
ncbi:MAG: YIP1 family protein [Desulfarculaceae bacterium]|jgi:hypothetical protein